MTCIRILVGDSLERLAELPENSVDSVVCDPPYGLKFMGKRWDAEVPKAELWAAVLRVLKPGGHLLASFGTRTYHRGVVAVEDGGFQIRDMVAWLYGQGMPKSKSIARVVDQHIDPVEPRGRAIPVASKSQPNGKPLTGNPVPPYEPRTDEGKQWDGFGTGLSPGLEPIVLARKPFPGTIAANVLEHGTAGLNIDGCRIHAPDAPESVKVCENVGSRYVGILNGGQRSLAAPRTTSASQRGRWPANVCHDGSQQVLALFPTTAPKRPSPGEGELMDTKSRGNWGFRRQPCSLEDAGGSAARYFYCSKASSAERDAGLGGPVLSGGERAGGRAEGSAGLDNPRAGTHAEGLNDHATVKPIDLMRWMVRLVTPPGGTVLDPFMGSGSTGVAAHLEGFGFIGCELDPHHAATAELRIRHYSGKADIVSEAPRGEVESREPDRIGFFT